MLILTHFMLLWLLGTCLGESVDDSVQAITQSFSQLQDALNSRIDTVMKLTRHVMLNRFQDEERVRAEGDSGIIHARNYYTGPANYYTATHTGHGFAAIHDHSQTPAVIGMGEVIAVINGVQFRTRHNDYMLKRPSTTSNKWHATEPIKPPPVPPTVLEKTSVQDQIVEMREYFRAFQQQNSSIRDYKPYFKPVLCYMEGTWLADYINIEEAFDSARSWYEAVTWEDLAERARIEAYIGAPDGRKQNSAQMPVTIMGIDQLTQEPVFAQWNYRIMCFPIEQDIPTSYFKIVDDNAYYFPRGILFENAMTKRGTHFVFDEKQENGYRDSSLLDRLISKIPGKDNLPKNMPESELEMLTESRDMTTGQILNLGYYNRMYKESRTDEMGHERRMRGFNDANLFTALTTQPEVAPLLTTRCDRLYRCKSFNNTRASWMIPLEVIYLSPLLNWNPYDILHYEGNPRDFPAKHVNEGPRNGYDENTAFNGTNDEIFFRTPDEFFFSYHPDDRDSADTVPSSRYVLDKKGKAHKMSASGTRIVLPTIEGAGDVRLRYPIAPIHGQGTAVWKELNAFKNYLAELFVDITRKVQF